MNWEQDIFSQNSKNSKLQENIFPKITFKNPKSIDDTLLLVSEKERKITLMNLTSDKNQRLQRLNTATVQGRPRRNTYVIDKVSEDHNLNSSTAGTTGTNGTNVSQVGYWVLNSGL